MAGRGRPRGFGKAPKEYKDRFQKHYYAHREELNEKRRLLYFGKKASGLCVRCRKKALKGKLFCSEHLMKSRSQKGG